MELSEIVGQYGTPPPELVKQRDNGSGFMANYVGHGDVTKMLIEIDPMWSWEPVAWIDGRPNIEIKEVTIKRRDGSTRVSRIATMWGFMTVLGKSLPCVGSASADKEDCEKELIGDLIRNGAMRFGVCLNLWADKDTNTPAATSSRQYETRQQQPTAKPAAASTGGMVTVKGNQYGELPQWLIDDATAQGVTEVYDNRNTATPENRRPWFKCTTNDRVAFWPPKGSAAPVVTEPAGYPDDEEPF